MVGNHPHCHLSILRLVIIVTGKFLDLADHSREHVRIVVALLALKYHAEPLEAHTRINVVVRQ